ncbi:hypothetical protein [Nocardia cyriacigeorgica]|uniref:Uncharacterized protein n=1 Tax=Nocardia cyriacigeorgica TaxID=135487 RepID=A0A5R8NEG5_9NOCA|nr:hypothetical protein [Nocardia cyriacigeorgica]TLF74040.1 hypothetical protein FEK34_25295 [Nocardia cyriacigeorgica]
MEDETLEERSNRIYHEIEQRVRREEAAWYPSRTLERTAWSVVGCWQMVISEVNAIYFHAAGPGAPPLVKTELPAKIRKAAEILGVRWPHDEWSAAAERTSKARHKLAHLLYIDSISGSRPHRTMTIGRMGAPGEPHKTSDGHPRGLSWRHIPDPDKEPDGVPWSQTTMHLDTVTEDEMADALGAMRWMRDCSRFLDYLGSVAREVKPRRGLVLPKTDEELLPWWFPDWGDPASTRLTWGDVLVPGRRAGRP